MGVATGGGGVKRAAYVSLLAALLAALGACIYFGNREAAPAVLAVLIVALYGPRVPDEQKVVREWLGEGTEWKQ